MKRNLMTWTGVLALAMLVSAAPEGKKEKAKEKAPKVTVGTQVGQKLPHFKASALDLTGEKPKATEFDSHKNDKATAYVFMSRTCPYCHLYQKRLAQMSADFAKKGVRFVMVYPTRKTSAEKKAEYHTKAGFGATPMINDKDASIAAALKIKKTPEVVLVTKEQVIAFRGGIDDNPRSVEKVKKPALKNAVNDVIAGRKVKVTTSPLYG